MLYAQSTALFASALSATTMLICLLLILHIHNDVHVAWKKLDNEMDQFKLITGDLWDDLLRIGRMNGINRHKRQYDNSDNIQSSDGGGYGKVETVKADPSYGGRSSEKFPSLLTPTGEMISADLSLTTIKHDRKISITPPFVGSPKIPDKSRTANERGRILTVDDSDTFLPADGGEGSFPPAGSPPPPQDRCKCDVDNKCPAGPPGPKGPSGNPGENGIPGEDGQSGGDAMDVLPPRKLNQCYTCPSGPTGIPGATGKSGLRGVAGSKGRNGVPGRHGQPGPPGEPGPPGKPGRVGEIGISGPKGSDAYHMVGRPGSKGAQGPPGPPGPEGKKGAEGQTGTAGPPGPTGNIGKPGPTGSPGKPGPEGDLGRPGRDAEYCPCPPKKSIKQILVASPENFGQSPGYRA